MSAGSAWFMPRTERLYRRDPGYTSSSRLSHMTLCEAQSTILRVAEQTPKVTASSPASLGAALFREHRCAIVGHRPAARALEDPTLDPRDRAGPPLASHASRFRSTAAPCRGRHHASAVFSPSAPARALIMGNGEVADSFPTSK